MTSVPHLRPVQPSDVARRCFDVAVSVVALLLLSPLIAVISFLIVLESGWPILFAQTRLGRDCHPFRMLKFRKFGSRCGTSGLALTLEGDSRG